MHSMNPHTFSRRALASLGAFAVTAALTVSAHEPASTEAGAVAPNPTASAGWRVYLDPETGEVTSTPSALQVQTLSERLDSKLESAALNRSSVGLEPFELRRGGRGVFLEGRYQSALRARFVDGRVEVECVDAGHDHASGVEHPAPDAGIAGERTVLSAPPASETIEWVER